MKKNPKQQNQQNQDPRITAIGPSSDHIDGILLDVEVREAIRQFDDIVRRATTDLMEVITRATAGKMMLMMRGLTGTALQPVSQALRGFQSTAMIFDEEVAAAPVKGLNVIVPITSGKKTPAKSAPAAATTKTGRRPMSPEARQRIINAQKKRWAKVRRARKQEQQVAASKPVKKAAKAAKTPKPAKKAVKKTTKPKSIKSTKSAKPANPTTPFPVKPSFASLS
jgi:hypothetical protein